MPVPHYSLPIVTRPARRRSRIAIRWRRRALRLWNWLERRHFDKHHLTLDNARPMAHRWASVTLGWAGSVFS